MNKKLILILLTLFTGMTVYSQEKVKNLKYARTEIRVPVNCEAKSEYELIDCNGFTAQWLFLKDEMIEQSIHKQVFDQIEQQFDYKKKKSLSFISQNQPFKGYGYEMKSGNYKIVGFGKVNDIYLILNLGFDKKPKGNSDLSEFEKNFINLMK